MGKNPTEVALAFVGAINAGSVERLANLMTDEHTFVDSDGAEARGKLGMVPGWASYFALVPDYKITVKETFAAGRTVMLAGEAEGTFADGGSLKPENHWLVPAAWRAVVEGRQVALWQVYVNTEPISGILKRIRGG